MCVIAPPSSPTVARLGWTRVEITPFMTNLRKINIWALLVPLLGLKIYAVNVEGKLPLPGMLAMLAVSLLALTKVEQQVSAKAAFQQGAMFLAYLFIFFVLLYWAGASTTTIDQLSGLITPALALDSLVTCLMTAVMEEIIFRKLLLGTLRKSMRDKVAVMVSAVIFYLCHMSVFPTIILSGIIYASLAIRFSSILLAVAIHAVYNFSGTLGVATTAFPGMILPDLTPYQLLHGGGAMADFIFMALYFAVTISCGLTFRLRSKV